MFIEYKRNFKDKCYQIIDTEFTVNVYNLSRDGCRSDIIKEYEKRNLNVGEACALYCIKEDRSMGEDWNVIGIAYLFDISGPKITNNWSQISKEMHRHINRYLLLQ